MKVPSIKASEIVKAPDAELIAVTKNGKGKMPAYDGKLTDAQIKETIAYIRTLRRNSATRKYVPSASGQAR